ncbi:hypothetical protein [Pilimelia terevasa]|uniref:hypothetical protein n=1 Tax=Pilimelia terevasa TaxID=53372 RepID=UPI001664F502|nr:hypothetical protein [Pilimelia terevasa]
MLAGCGADTARPGAAPPPPLSGAGQTACRDALATQKVRWAAFDGRWGEVLRALDSGDETGSAAAGEIASQELYEWARELGLLLPRAPDPPLRTGLEGAISALNALAAPEDETPANEMRARVRDAAQQVAGVCGGTAPPVP